MPQSNTPSDGAPRRADPRPTILLVEDDPMVRRLYEDMLDRCGFAVVAAADGSNGLTAFYQASNLVQLVMLDLDLPDMTGLELLARLRQKRPRLPAVVVSGRSEVEMAGDPLAPAVFLAKPFRREDLQDAIHRVRGEEASMGDGDGV